MYVPSKKNEKKTVYLFVTVTRRNGRIVAVTS